MPPLARLSFWLALDRHAAFRSVFRTQLLPVLQTHGLESAQPSDRREAEGVCSWLLAVDSAAQVIPLEKALRQDPVWQLRLQELGRRFGGSGEVLRYAFGLYWAPAGPGQRMEAGAGVRRGLWHSLGVEDGLLAAHVRALWQDRQGFLWLATARGISRFDGAEFVHLGVADGLADHTVQALLEDGQGRLWLGTGGDDPGAGRGLCCYEGEQVTTFTTADGLGSDVVRCLWEDQQGGLWVGTDGGVSWYDGEQFTTFTTADGLLNNRVGTFVG